MHNPPSASLVHSTLLEHALLVAKVARPLVEVISRKDRDLASQVRRAVSSIALNIAEAHGVASGNARLRFETARGSLYEAQAGIRVAIAWGYFTEACAGPALRALDELGVRLYGLVRR
jgi:four helix bundle protein